MSAALALVLVLASAPSWGQLLTKEQLLHQLRLQESQLHLEMRRANLQSYGEELESTRELFERGFIARQQYQQTRNRYEQARLNYEDAEIQLEKIQLELLKNATRIVVTEARKYRTEEGRSWVDITLENASDARGALLVDPDLGEEELRVLLKVENIYVSLVNGPIVGEPYEIHIPTLEVAQRCTLTFRLLSAVNSVGVHLQYLDLREEISVILRKGSQQDLPSINSSQFSQEGPLAQSVRFALTLERLADEERSFALSVIGLPSRINYAFIHQGARVSQVKFDLNTSKAQLQLRLDIPEKLAPRFIGQRRSFFALVAHPGEYARINALKARYGDEPLPEEEIQALQCDYVRLELMPKGVGQLEVLVANRYREIQMGEELALRVEFLNRGTVAVQNIESVLDLPYQWQSEVNPAFIKLLKPGERTVVEILARPSEEAVSGDFEFGIEAQGQVGTDNVESPKKKFTIRIRARSNITGNAVLIGLLVALVVGMGLASVRISRR